MQVANVKFKNITEDIFLRNDVKYHIFVKKYKWNIFNIKDSECDILGNILIKDFSNFNYENDEYKGIQTGASYVDSDGDITDYISVTKEDHPSRLKYKINSEDILLSSLRLAKAPAMNFENINYDEYVFSNGYYIFKISENWNKKFLMYVLRLSEIKKIIDESIYRGIGISAYKTEDLFKIKIPIIKKDIQNKFCQDIKNLEEKIRKEKLKIKKL